MLAGGDAASRAGARTVLLQMLIKGADVEGSSRGLLGLGGEEGRG